MYSRILVPVDGSPTSSRGLEEAIKLAKLTGAQLRLLHVVDELSAAMGMGGFAPVTVDVFRLLKEGAEQVLKDASATVQQGNVPVDSVLIRILPGGCRNWWRNRCGSGAPN